MSQIYMKNTVPQKDAPTPRKAQTGPSVAGLAAGARPTAEQMGSRVDLPGEIREKMESAFGADFSHVKFYESQTVADAGAQAVTQGSNIAFAPGKLDLTSTAGQALLGHELSHVVSQARGESAGRGFLNVPRLEAQADRQGMLAARGESVYEGPVGPIGTSSAVGAAGPMQAKKYEEKAGIQMERQGIEGNAGDLKFGERRRLANAYDAEEKRRKAINAPSSTRTKGTIPDEPVITEDSSPIDISAAENVAAMRSLGNQNMVQYLVMSGAGNNVKVEDSQKDFLDWYNTEFSKEDNAVYDSDRILTTGSGHAIAGLNLDRNMLTLLDLGRECGMDDDQIKDMIRDLMVKKRKDAANPESEDEAERARAAEESQRTDAALMKMKGLYYHGLKKARDKYGVMMTQLHPEDAFNQAGDFWKDTHITQDCMQLLTDAPELFTPGNKDDEEFNNLNQYYMATLNLMGCYPGLADELERIGGTGRKSGTGPLFQHLYGNAKIHEANILANDRSNMPQMREREMAAYRRNAMKKKNASLGFDDFFKDEDAGRDNAAFMASDVLPRKSGEGVESLDDLLRRKQERTTGG